MVRFAEPGTTPEPLPGLVAVPSGHVTRPLSRPRARPAAERVIATAPSISPKLAKSIVEQWARHEPPPTAHTTSHRALRLSPSNPPSDPSSAPSPPQREIRSATRERAACMAFMERHRIPPRAREELQERFSNVEEEVTRDPYGALDAVRCGSIAAPRVASLRLCRHDLL